MAGSSERVCGELSLSTYKKLGRCLWYVWGSNVKQWANVVCGQAPGER